ncbi:fungal specific transcription factor domain-containing protein [Rhizoctonia solani AG-1 IA]|uniref:Fungal specific transcription factor domain-containing protein n=1 Tax=Thanatephorus cucumeris (strain AG1-IA) TaxID=983506 RepID=L8WWM2_THACA|nr:fungal specific transcription factor domain-containing protein [Rhizoctonia solani AG-1 IA]
MRLDRVLLYTGAHIHNLTRSRITYRVDAHDYSSPQITTATYQTLRATQSPGPITIALQRWELQPNRVGGSLRPERQSSIASQFASPILCVPVIGISHHTIINMSDNSAETLIFPRTESGRLYYSPFFIAHLTLDTHIDYEQKCILIPLVASNLEQPCLSCLRSHNRVIRTNPHLKHIPPTCTYGASNVIPRASEIPSQHTLRGMEARVEELERQLRLIGNSESLNSDIPMTRRHSLSVNDGEIYSYDPNQPEDTLAAEHPALNSAIFIDNLPLTIDEWPLELPPKPLLLHLVDIFFTCYPNARRAIHRPTLMVQLLANPASPFFPFIPLLHAICTAAAIYSPLVETTPPPNLHADDIFLGQTLVDRGRNLRQKPTWCDTMCVPSIGDLIWPVTSSHSPASVIGAWWAFSMSSFAMRLCVALGLNFADSLQNPLPNKIREKVLVGPPNTETDVELRRNIFWLAYCLESDEDVYQTLPGTLEAFESGVSTLDLCGLCTLPEGIQFDDGQERQTILSKDLFSNHYSNQDDFTIIEDAQNSQDMRDLELMITLLRATARVNMGLANWQDPGCESANKMLSASRIPWVAAGRALTFALEHAPESLAPILRAEIRLVRQALEFVHRLICA